MSSKIASEMATQAELPHSSNTQYVVAVVIMSLLTVVAILAIIMLRPDKENTALISTVVGALVPATLALLALMKGQETHSSVNSRLSEWKIEMLTRMELAIAHAHAQGVIEGTKGASDVVTTNAAAIAAAIIARQIVVPVLPVAAPAAASTAAVEANTVAVEANTVATSAVAEKIAG